MKRRRKEKSNEHEGEGESSEESSEVPPHKKLKEKKQRKREKERHTSEELPSHSPGQAREARHTPSAGGEEDEGERSPCKRMKEKKKKRKKEDEEGSKQKEGNEGAESHGCDGVGMNTSEQNPTETSTKQRVYAMKESDPQRRMFPPAGRHYTVSIALPGSIIDNAQTHELKTYLAGQIARTAAVFSIDEVVVFDEQGKPGSAITQQQKSDPNLFLARLLQYQETPQYLRKVLFPMHPDLKFAGLLNPLDCPHHMRIDDICQYREGVVLEQPVQEGSRRRDEDRGSLVNCGMRKKVQIDRKLKAGTRVTVKLHTSIRQRGGGKLPRGEVVAPSVPRTRAGLYWGYNVRLASTFSAVFTESPHKGGYDLTIGTSERGENIDTVTELPSFRFSLLLRNNSTYDLTTSIPNVWMASGHVTKSSRFSFHFYFRHLLVVFGGLKGLEYCLECDEALQMADVSLLFHRYLNTCPAQGSRTIRTEEAMLISLAALRPLNLKNARN